MTEDEIPDITNLATNTTLNAKINEIKGEIPSIANLATNSALNAKINEVKGKILSITNLATNTALTAVANKIPNVSNLAKNTDYNTKINEIEKKITDHGHSNKYITTQEFKNFLSENFVPSLAQANLASKNDISALVRKKDFDDKLKNLNKKVTSNKSKHLLVENELKILQDKMERLQTFDSSLFIGQSYFFNDVAQLYLKFQIFFYISKKLGDNKKIVLGLFEI